MPKKPSKSTKKAPNTTKPKPAAKATKSTAKAAKPAAKATKSPAKAKAPARAAKTTNGRRRAGTEDVPTAEAIAVRAYYIYEAEGGGEPLDHWLRAERELTRT